MISKVITTALSLLLLNSIFVVAYADDSKTVADELNTLYNKTGGCSNGNPDFYCSGIILHAETLSETDEPWYLPTTRDVGSFSYIRHDIVAHIGIPIWDVFLNTGYILTPPQELQNAKEYPYEVYCSYPVNAGSNSRLKYGCGDFKLLHAKNTDYSNCASKGVSSIAQYMSKYSKETVVPTQHGDMVVTQLDQEACSFSPTAAGFKLSMDLSKYILRDNPEKICTEYATDREDFFCRTNNELIISTWPKEKVDASQVPIKAFFVLINDKPIYNNDVNEALRVAFKKSADYSAATHQSRHIPVVTIDINKLKDGSTDIFAPAVEPVN